MLRISRNGTSELCKWLHEQLEQLPLIRYPFKQELLPENGIYFFYEDGEVWGHGGYKPRIVRVGTHRNGNFPKRISEHYLLDESKMNFDRDKPKPSDRSIFRKNIGRALLNKANDDYLSIWDIDFIKSKNKILFANRRNIKKEKEIESKITEILRQKFCFRFVIVKGSTERIGRKGLESALIGTLAHCSLCRPSGQWLGNHSPKKQIRESGLWLVQHLKANGMKEKDKEAILNAIRYTKKWIANSPYF